VAPDPWFGSDPERLDLPGDDDQSRVTLGRCGSYDLLVELAAGGMATVYLARKRSSPDAPLVAVKRPHRHLASDKTFLAMLVDEARLASAIEHPNVVKVRELGFDGGEPFIVMDYVEGASLADIRGELSPLGRALAPRFALRMTLDALAGLEAAHVLQDEGKRPLGIVHRDVSPHNVLVGCDGRARLTDFGIAKAADRVQVTRTHEVKGKLAYLAPERVDKRRLCTVQSDVFSMAVVLWECIAGRRLFRGEEAMETLQAVVGAPIPRLRAVGAAIPPALDDAILRGLARDLPARFKTAAEFAAALSRAAGGADHIASAAEVARLVEALFGERLRVRHADIRRALPGDHDAAGVLRGSQLALRSAPDPEAQHRERLAVESLAPTAPLAPSVALAPASAPGPRSGSTWLRVAALAGACLVGTAVLAGVLAGKEPPAAGYTGAATDRPPKPPASLPRKVVVPLPFVALRVTLDDQALELSPPAEVAAFDVPAERGVRHRITVVGVDGSRAEATVREASGGARAEGDGFVVESPETAADDGVSAFELPPTPNGVKRIRKLRDGGRPAASPSVGIVKDGFTKLR
jgi:serine/threonine-protein kinase